MTWNYFIGFMWVFFCLVALSASLGVGLYYLILGVEQVLREEAKRRRKGNDTSSQPSPQRGEGGTGRGGKGGDEHDLDGGVGGAPVCP